MRAQTPFCERNLDRQLTAAGKLRRFGKCMCRSIASEETRSDLVSSEVYSLGPG